MEFTLWLEAEEADNPIKQQVMQVLGSATDIGILGQISISAVHGKLREALETSGWFKQNVPPDVLQRAIGWLALNKASDRKVLDLINLLSGKQSFDSAQPAKPQAPRQTPQAQADAGGGAGPAPVQMHSQVPAAAPQGKPGNLGGFMPPPVA